VDSPCIKLCKLNEHKICVGCYRTLDEIKNWGIFTNPGTPTDNEVTMQVTIDPQKELEDKAISLLEYDDANPEVGMGMFIQTAVDYALKSCIAKFGVEFESHVNIDSAINNVLLRRARVRR
jgi:predicted Fe-S protein YdhL (DUF1289 family)